MFKGVFAAIQSNNVCGIGKTIAQLALDAHSEKEVYGLFELFYFKIYKLAGLADVSHLLASEIDYAASVVYKEHGVNKILDDLLECKYKLIASSTKFWCSETRVVPNPEALGLLSNQIGIDEKKFEALPVFEFFRGLIAFANKEFIATRKHFDATQEIADNLKLPLRFYNTGLRTYLPHVTVNIGVEPVDCSMLNTFVKETGIFRVVFFSDERYFCAFAPLLLEKAKKLPDEMIFHFHVVNPSSATLSRLAEEQKSHANVNYSFEEGLVVDTSYYTIIRMLRSEYIYNIYDGNLIFLDIDNKLELDISHFLSATRGIDFGLSFSRGWGAMVPWLGYTASLIYFGKSFEARKLARFLSIQAKHHYYNGPGPKNKWWIDQNVLSFVMSNLRYVVDCPIVSDLRSVNIAMHDLSYKVKQLDNYDRLTHG